MLARSVPVCLILLGSALAHAQDAAPAPSPAPPAELPPIPKGVEVMARGPVHEAFATPTTEPQPTKAVPKAPPKPLDELPPEEKPEGNAVWIGGYWAWDDERNDFLWVSGVWRVPPPGKHWVPGYWREDREKWQWVPGMWLAAPQKEGAEQQVTYLPAPPAPPEVALPAQPPQPDSFYVPGCWEWRGGAYAWRAGYWARVQPGYVWVPAHYRWTPAGYVFVPGYWDLALSRRGILYAPVVVDVAVVGPAFVYTPAYAVPDRVVVEALFVRPCCCHYYFGDYYGPVYRDLGYESCVIYSRRRYDAIFVYERWERRADPRWESVQIDICLARHAGRAPLPPRTLVQQNNIVNVTNVTNVTNVNVQNTTINRASVNKTQMVVPASKLAASGGVKTVALDQTARLQAKQQAAAVAQQVARQRAQVEAAAPSGPPNQPRVASLAVPPARAVGPRPAPPPAATAARPAAPPAAQGPRPAPAPAASHAVPPRPQQPGALSPPRGVSHGPAVAPPQQQPGAAPHGQVPARPGQSQPPRGFPVPSRPHPSDRPPPKRPGPQDNGPPR
ncbi:MAG TPA: hypothetical protein VFA26_01075 [Gemmataceae bacterium]|nr:hypothetical protein [Gemmataceae bacterium]